MSASIFFGVDVGQATDPTAFALLEIDRKQVRDGPIMREEVKLHLHNLMRVPLGTPYPTVIEQIKRTLELPEFKGKSELIVDATGVGRPIVDMCRRAELHPIAVTITGGEVESHEDWRWRVPKRNLVMDANLLLQTGKLRVAQEIPEREVFERELQNFKVKVSAAGHDSYEAEKSGEHDDLVIAVALACWRALKHVPALHAKPKPLPTPRQWSENYADKLSRRLKSAAR